MALLRSGNCEKELKDGPARKGREALRMAIATARLFEFAVIDTASRYSGTDELYLCTTCLQNADLPIVPKELPKAKPMIAIPKSTSLCSSLAYGLFMYKRNVRFKARN